MGLSEISILKDLKAIYAIGEKINSTLNFSDVFEELVSCLKTIMPAEVAVIYTVNYNTNSLDLRFNNNRNDKLTSPTISLQSKESFFVWSVLNSKEMFLNDISREYSAYLKKYYWQNLDLPSSQIIHSFICIPLIINSKPIGVFSVQSNKRNSYTNLNLQVLKYLGSFISIAFKNADIFHQMKILNFIGEKITSTLDFSQVFNELVENLRKIMVAEAAVIYTINKDSNCLELKYKSMRDDRITSNSIPIDSEVSFFAWSVRNNKEILINDVQAEYSKYIKDYYWNNSGLEDSEIINSFICIPLVIDSKVIGVFSVQSYKKNIYTEYNLEALKSLAASVSIAFNNADTFRQLNAAKETIELQKTAVEKEKQLSEELLLNILPAEVAEELKLCGKAKAQHIEEVTVIFTDFKGFTQMTEKLTPAQLILEINDYFEVFDHIMTKHNIEKIKTIGDAYMAVGGLPTPNKTHASDVVKAALEIQNFMLKRAATKKANGELFFEIRIGVHTGPVVAGIVGVKKFQYDIWGDTVNIASRMESSGEVGKVNISRSTFEKVKDEFHCVHRGQVQAKGKGEMDMYFVEGRI